MLLSELIEAVPDAALTLLNPEVSLERPVSGIDSSEAPDVAPYLAKHALLLTTAMIFGADQSGLTKLIDELDGAQAAGLVIKTGRFVDAIDPGVLAHAAALGFPVFSIPPTTTLGITYHLLQSHIWGIETHDVYRTLEIQKKLSQMLFDGVSLPAMLQYVSQAIGLDAYCYDYFFDLVAVGYGGTGSSGGAGSAGGAPSARRDESLASEIGALLGAAHRAHPIIAADEFALETSRGAVRCLVLPLMAGDEHPRFLAIAYHDALPEQFLFLVGEQAATVFSFQAYNQQRLVEQVWSSAEESFQRLLRMHGQIDPALIDLGAVSSQFSFADLGFYQIVCVGFDARRLPAELAGRNHFALVCRWLEKRTTVESARFVLIPLRSIGRFVLFVRSPQVMLPQLLHELSDGLKEHLDIELRFGVGNQARRVESLNSSFIEASTALTRALEDPSLPIIQFYASEGVSELLQFAPDDHLRHFCEKALGDLAYPERESLQELRRTLEAYLDCQGDITHTAKQLFVHRNTVRYRIDKIQNSLGRQLDDPAFSLQLRLAVYLSTPQENQP